MSECTLHGELVLAIDFDGLITTRPGFSDHPLELQEGCHEVLTRLHQDGVRLLLWTCRTAHALDAAKSFLEAEGLLQVFEQINEQCDEVREMYHPHVGRKLGADAYFDDKNLGVSYMKGFTPEGKTIVDWYEIARLIYGL